MQLCQVQALVARAQGGYNKNSKESSATMEPERALKISPRSLSSIMQSYDVNILILLFCSLCFIFLFYFYSLGKYFLYVHM